MERSQTPPRNDVVEEEEERRKTDEGVWESVYSPDTYTLEKCSPLKKDGVAVESDG